MWKTKLSCKTPLKQLQVADVKATLSWEMSLKTWKLKMRKPSFRARFPSKTESWSCENEALVRNLIKISSSCAKQRLKRQLQCGADPTMIRCCDS